MKRNLFALLRTFVFLLPLSLCFVSCEEFDWNSLLGGDNQETEGDSVVIHGTGYYKIPNEYLDGWDEGVITSDKHYFVVKSDTVTNGYIGYMNDSINSTLGLAMFFDEDFYVTKMVFAEGVMHIERNESKNSAFILFVDSLGTVLFEEEVELSSNQSLSASSGMTRAGGVSASQCCMVS